MEAKRSKLTTIKRRAKKSEGATPEEALKAIESYYGEISDDQFAKDVRDACTNVENESVEASTHTEEKNSGHRSSVLQ